MKKIFLLGSIFFLLIFTTFTKNSTKKIEKKIYDTKEALRILNHKHQMILLEFNYLSSPNKLIDYQLKYFENDLIKVDINDLQIITLNNEKIENIEFIINKDISEK